MKRAFLMAVLSAVCGVACAQEDTNLYYKVFVFPPPRGCRFGPASNTYAQPNTKFKEYLTQLCGVSWPSGAETFVSFEEEGDPNKVIVSNTRSNLNVIAKGLAPHLLACQIAFEFQVFAFSIKDVERLLNGEGVSCESLMDLRNNGRARLVTTARSIMRSGQEALVKDVKEILYPTEMDYEVGTNQVGGAWVVAPANFEMREVGTIHQVNLEFDSNEEVTQITANINSQRISLDSWETFDAGAGSKGESKKLSLRQPVFNASTIQTLVKLESDETVLLGGGKAIDGDWVHYHFFKAWLVWPKAPK